MLGQCKPGFNIIVLGVPEVFCYNIKKYENVLNEFLIKERDYYFFPKQFNCVLCHIYFLSITVIFFLILLFKSVSKRTSTCVHTDMLTIGVM